MDHIITFTQVMEKKHGWRRKDDTTMKRCRWEDDVKRIASPAWIRRARDGKIRKSLEEFFVKGLF